MTVVIGSGVVLAPNSETNADSPIIGWRNIVTIENVTADEEAAGYPATNLANPITSSGAGWRGETAIEQYVTVLTGTADDLDYVGIARHNFGSAGIAVSIEGRADSGDPYTELVAAVIPANDTPLIFRFAKQPLYQVRVKLAAGTEAPRAAVLYLGELLIVQRRLYVGHTPITLGRDIQVANGRSESGSFLGRIVLGEGRSTSVSLSNLTPDWYRDEFDPFVVAAAEAPFFFAWRPGSHADEVGYAWLTGDPRPVNQRSNGMMSVELQMAGIA